MDVHLPPSTNAFLPLRVTVIASVVYFKSRSCSYCCSNQLTQRHRLMGNRLHRELQQRRRRHRYGRASVTPGKAEDR